MIWIPVAQSALTAMKSKLMGEQEEAMSMSGDPSSCPNVDGSRLPLCICS